MPNQGPTSSRIRHRPSRAILDSEDDTKSPTASPKSEPGSEPRSIAATDPGREDSEPATIPIIIGPQVSGKRINLTTRAFCLEHATLSAAVQVSSPPRVQIDNIAIGVMIMDRMPPSTQGQPRILLARRLPKKCFKPGRWQFPAGSLDGADEERTVKQAIVDLVREELGLVVREIVAEIQPLCYSKPELDDNETPDILTTQFNFVIDARDSSTIQPNPTHFSSSKWVTRTDIQAQAQPPDMDLDMRAVVMDAFHWAERRVRGAVAAGREYEKAGYGDEDEDVEMDDEEEFEYQYEDED